MMSDLISRQAAIDEVKKNTFRLTFAKEQGDEGRVAWSAKAVYSDVIEGALLELPSVTLQPKMGQWEWVQYDYNPKLGNWHCSECRSIVFECANRNEPGGIPLYKYCPQCGAKMEVKND